MANKYFHLIILILINIRVFSQNKIINYDNLVLHYKKNGERFFTEYGSNRKFTGLAVIYSTYNKIKYSVQLKNGVKKGFEKVYTEKGLLLSKCKIWDTLVYDCKIYRKEPRIEYRYNKRDTDSVSIEVMKIYYDSGVYNYYFKVKNQNINYPIFIAEDWIYCHSFDTSGTQFKKSLLPSYERRVLLAGDSIIFNKKYNYKCNLFYYFYVPNDKFNNEYNEYIQCINQKNTTCHFYETFYLPAMQKVIIKVDDAILNKLKY
jgi:hypothetical protein